MQTARQAGRQVDIQIHTHTHTHTHQMHYIYYHLIRDKISHDKIPWCEIPQDIIPESEKRNKIPRKSHNKM